jgi:proline iminopeptidase
MALRHPAAVAGLVLVATAAAFSETGTLDVLHRRAGPEALAAALRVYGGDCCGEAVADFVRLVAPAYGHDPASAGRLGDVFAHTSFSPEVAGHFFGRLAADYDLRPRLGDVRAPTLVVAGEHDWVCPPSAAETLGTGIPGADLLVLPGVGHFPFVEHPDAFLAAVRRFLGAVAP